MKWYQHKNACRLQSEFTARGYTGITRTQPTSDAQQGLVPHSHTIKWHKPHYQIHYQRCFSSLSLSQHSSKVAECVPGTLCGLHVHRIYRFCNSSHFSLIPRGTNRRKHNEVIEYFSCCKLLGFGPEWSEGELSIQHWLWEEPRVESVFEEQLHPWSPGRTLISPRVILQVYFPGIK